MSKEISKVAAELKERCDKADDDNNNRYYCFVICSLALLGTTIFAIGVGPGWIFLVGLLLFLIGCIILFGGPSPLSEFAKECGSLTLDEVRQSSSIWYEVQVMRPDSSPVFIFSSWSDVEKFCEGAIGVGRVRCHVMVDSPNIEKGLPRRIVTWDTKHGCWREEWPGVEDERKREDIIIDAGAAIIAMEEEEEKRRRLAYASQQQQATGSSHN